MKALIIRMYGLYLDFLGLVAPGKAGELGLRLFCKPYRIPISEKQKHFFNTADKSILKLEEQTIQIYKWGNGSKKILFLHGWQSHTYRWKAYIEAMSKEDYTIYSLDAPGHGLSEGDFLSMPLYSTLVENFIREKGSFHTVVGHSLGGFTLLYTLYRQPLLPVNKVILMAPPGEVSDFVTVFRKTLKISDRTLQLVVDQFINRFGVSPEYFSSLRFAPKVNVKGLIIHDEEDKEAPYHNAVPLHQAWEKSRLITTKGLGHNLRSTTIVKHVTDFIEDAVHQPVY